jgi:hypothetical protein
MKFTKRETQKGEEKKKEGKDRRYNKVHWVTHRCFDVEYVFVRR